MGMAAGEAAKEQKQQAAADLAAQEAALKAQAKAQRRAERRDGSPAAPAARAAPRDPGDHPLRDRRLDQQQRPRPRWHGVEQRQQRRQQQLGLGARTGTRARARTRSPPPSRRRAAGPDVHPRRLPGLRNLRPPRRTPRGGARRAPSRSRGPWSGTSTPRAAGSGRTPTSPGSTASRAGGSTSTRCWSRPSGSPVRAAAVTDGLVHPLLGRPLVTLGYDRDFRELRGGRDRRRRTPPRPRVDAWRGSSSTTRRVRIPAGTALDLGSTAKAWAADLVAAGLEQELGEPALVSLGGDIADLRAGRRAVAGGGGGAPGRPPRAARLPGRPHRGRPGDVEHTRPPLDASAARSATTCSTRARASRPRRCGAR